MGRAVEEIAASLVREYLSRQGLKRTIACMDEELPRTASSINNRTDLRRILHLDVLYKENKALEVPFKSMLEIIVKQQMEADRDSMTGCGSEHQTVSYKKHMPMSDSALMSQNRDCDILEEGRGESTAVSDYSQIDVRRSPKSEDLFPSSVFLSSQAQTCFTKATKQTVNSRSSLDAKKGSRQLSLSQEKFCSYKTGLSVERNNFTETPKNRTSRPLRGMMAGPTASSAPECNKKRQTRKLCGSNPPQEKSEDDKDYLFPTTVPLSSMEIVKIECRKEKVGLSNHLVGPTGMNDVSSLEQEEKGLRITQRGDWQNNMSQAQKNIASTCKDDLKMGTMILDDVNAEDEPCELSLAPDFSSAPQMNVSTHPIDQDTANALKELLFGSSLGCFNEEWKAQSFTFSDVPGLTYGIVQKKGGPCGVLASLQACVLQKLLFENMSSRSACQKQQLSNVEQSKCLVLAIAEILWRAGGGKMATVVMSSGRQQFIPAGRYKSDGIMETLTSNKVNNFEDLKLLLEHHIQQFELGPFGCILFTISAILSRSIEMVRTDFDVPTNTLIGAHGYCSQELVNLLLCGQAVSNVFNDDIELDSGNGNITLLKGIKQQSDIGLFSLFEHYNICKVGSYLKTPKFPIWLVCSESHFTVLFCTCMELMSDWMKERNFDLYYYDGLANQQEEICLTISTSNSSRHCSQDVDNDLIPPLEHCIRTKWKDAMVNWNETEPIL